MHILEADPEAEATPAAALDFRSPISAMSEAIKPRAPAAPPPPKDGTGTVPATGKVGKPREIVRLLRPKEWVKNIFVAAPFLLTPEAQSWGAAFAVFWGILAFSAVASAVYVLNDYQDREADRHHPVKRHRPLAAGTVSPTAALSLLGFLLGVGFGLALWLSIPFALVVGAYFLLNVGYSYGLKDVAIMDVLIIAMGFILRVEAGALLVGVIATIWITLMTGLMAVFIGLAKRRDDLIRAMGADHRSSLQGYNKAFLDNAVTVVLGALLVAYLIYTTDREVAARMGTDGLVYTTPFVLVGILRYLQLMFVEERSGNPTDLVLKDRVLRGSIVGWAVAFGVIIYL